MPDESYYRSILTDEEERKKIREASLAFRNNPSERNKERAFLRYYGEEISVGNVTHQVPFHPRG